MRLQYKYEDKFENIITDYVAATKGVKTKIKKTTPLLLKISVSITPNEANI